MFQDVVKTTQQSHAHHYVPQWYQRGFLAPGATRYFYLDLSPEERVREGICYRRNALHYWGPRRCFYQEDLYTANLGAWTSDEVERRFFGAVDCRGREAVLHFAAYQGICEKTLHAAKYLPPYMDAQKFRTPKGLDLIRSLAGNVDYNTLLSMMSKYFQYSTMWTEGVWEIVNARSSPTKFIVSDEPVTFYCRVTFPSNWKYPNEISLRQVGTRTIFPLTSEACMVITHLQLARNPCGGTPTEHRTNARSYQSAINTLTDIQFGRELDEDEVLRINYIMKKRARRYIAAAEEEWLFPERRVSTTNWEKLDDDWFLLPNPWLMPFSGGVYIGYGDGTTSAYDEYGRRPWQLDYRDRQQHEAEWESFQLAKRVWAKKRRGKPRAQLDKRIGRGATANELIDDYLREEGLLPPKVTPGV